jgi:small subunit ribosomal protein S5
MRSAPAGTGVIAGSAMRAIFECAGINDVVAKSLGTSNPYNMVWATFQALQKLSSPRSIADRRSKEVSEIIKRRNSVLKINNNNNEG